jgi:hypothetical protein
VRLMIAIAGLALLAACGSGSDADADAPKEVPADQVLQPTKADASWTAHVVGVVTLSTPETWEAGDPTDPGQGGKAEQVLIQTPVNTFGTRGGAQVAVLEKRKKPAADLVATIESTSRATIGATDFTSEEIVWPGADDAWLLEYVAQVPHDGKTAPHPTQVLLLDLADGGQAQITVSALADSPDEELLSPVLESVTVEGTSS